MAIFADEFRDMMAAVVTVQAIVDRAYDNAPVYGSPQSYQARITYKTENVVAHDGAIVVARGWAWLDTVEPISVNDLVTFPNGEQPNVLNVNLLEDETGPAYTKLYFQ